MRARLPVAAGNAGVVDASAPVVDAGALPPAAKPALLSITTTPKSDVTLDGKLLGHTPFNDIPVPPGEHTLEFVSKKPKMKMTQKITLAEGETKSLKVKLKRK